MQSSRREGRARLNFKRFPSLLVPRTFSIPRQIALSTTHSCFALFLSRRPLFRSGHFLPVLLLIERLPQTNYEPSKMILATICRVALPLSLMATRTEGVAQTAGCIGSTNELVVEESKVTDLSVTREYVLCEDTVYSIGFQDYYSSKVLQGGSDMLQLRPNLHLKCGATGSKSNNCLVTSGDVQMEGTTFYGAPGDVLENVVITGVTFADAGKHMVWINKPGDILFHDCEFRVSSKYPNLSSPLHNIIHSSRCSSFTTGKHGGIVTSVS